MGISAAICVASCVVLALSSSARGDDPPSPGAAWPVDSPVLVSGFRPPQERWQSGHRGIDLQAHGGDPVRAMAAGTVVFAGFVAGKPVLVLALAGAGGRRLSYEPVFASVFVGTVVKAGDLVGTVASTGGHCGALRGCVHVGLRVPGGYADPLDLLGERPAVLKPP